MRSPTRKSEKPGSENTSDTKELDGQELTKPHHGRKSLIVKRLEAMQVKALARQQALHKDTKQKADKPTEESSTKQRTHTPSTNLTKDRSSQLNQRLFQMEQRGLFDTIPLAPNNEFPTLLTRLPIFRPSQRAKQKNLLNHDNALEFTTPFGNGKRHGPLLTIRDEDTLIAIMRLRDRRLLGVAANLPIPIASIFANSDGRVEVHCVLCTVQDINKEKKLTNGGINYKATIASIRRLAATSIELNIKRHERYLGPLEEGTTIRMLDVKWELYKEDGILLIQIPPVIASWLDKEYTYIDWHTRLQLNDLGKSLHRFLSSQPQVYQGQVLKIAQAIGYDGPTKNVKPRFRESLEKLKQLSWLKTYRFVGTGRQSPLVLRIER